MFILFSTLFFLSSYQLIALAARQFVQRELAAKAAIQREADHRRYLVFRGQREANRLLIQQQVEEEGRALEREWATKQQAWEARRRLVPDWTQVGLLLHQNRVSEEEYRAYCFDNTGEYCPALLLN